MVKGRDKHRTREFHFLLIFLAVYIVFHTLYFIAPNSFLRETLYHAGVVSVSAKIIGFFAPVEFTSAISNKLVSSKASLGIARGCIDCNI